MCGPQKTGPLLRRQELEPNSLQMYSNVPGKGESGCTKRPLTPNIPQLKLSCSMEMFHTSPTLALGSNPLYEERESVQPILFLFFLLSSHLPHSSHCSSLHGLISPHRKKNPCSLIVILYSL